MNKQLSEIWDNLTIWRKSAIAITAIMWMAFSAEIAIAVSENLILMAIALCGLWLGFIVVAFIVTNVGSEVSY